jgi:hypothetical protein
MINPYYNYPIQDIKANIQIIKDKGLYMIKKVKFPSSIMFIKGKKDIVFSFYEVKDRSPVILISPIAGGNYSIERSFARYFAKHGISSIIVFRRKELSKPNEDIESFENELRQIVVDYRQVLDWLYKEGNIDEDSIGAFGISFGGILTSIISSIDYRIKCYVTGLAGGPIADILSYSNEITIKRERASVMKRLNISLMEFHDRLLKGIKTDPIILASNTNHKRGLMFIAIFDHVIRRKYAENLRKASGSPETIYLPLGHYTSILALPYVKWKVLSFFRNSFGIK